MKWKTVRDNSIYFGEGRDFRIVWDEEAGRDVAYVVPPDETDNGNKNAALIAAAPDLLAACEGMAERLREYCAEFRSDGMGKEASNIERIAATLERSAKDAKTLSEPRRKAG